MGFKRKIPLEKRVYASLLTDVCGWSIRQVAAKLGISKSSVHRFKFEIMKERRLANAVCGRGRPRKITPRQMRRVSRCMEHLRKTEGFFTSDRLMEEAGISKETVSGRTFRRHMNAQGYFFLNARQKGLMNQEDRRLRVAFAKETRSKYPKTIWTEGIAFYLDGVNFVYKTKPKDQAYAPRRKVWRKKSEGLKQGCVAKGRKEGTGANVVRLMVAVAYKKGVIICEEYDKMNGDFFADFVDRNFIDLYGKADKDNVDFFVQDGDPSQNSRKAKEALSRAKAKIFAIPPRSPDLNPIENLFHLTNKELRRSAKSIDYESRDEFVARIRKTLNSIPVETIDKTIESMDKRLGLIIKNNGEKTKY